MPITRIVILSHPLRIAIVAILLLLMVPSGETRAFKKSGSDSQTHTSITKQALKEVYRDYFHKSALGTQEEMVIDQVVKGNLDTDSIFWNQFKPELHFDSESFPEGQRRLIELLGKIEGALDNGNGERAREHLGSALHSIQDFYAHSTWIEMGNRVPHPDLGRPGREIPRESPDVATCARDEVRTPGEGFENVFVYSNRLLQPVRLTSGYWPLITEPGPSPAYGVSRSLPEGKCVHGGFVTEDVYGLLGGINKDDESSRFHNDAANVALAASKQYLADIEEKVGPEKYGLLFGIGTTLAFSIDVSGSMDPIIAGVRAQSSRMVDRRVQAGDVPGKFVLVPFSDPDVTPPIVEYQPEAFKSRLGALSSGGGGDCPELAMESLLKALAKMDTGGTLFLWTDASAKDEYLADSVINEAKENHVTIVFLLFGSCSGSNSVYDRVAGATGGASFTLSSPEEAESISELVDFLVRSDSTDLLVAEETLNSSAAVTAAATKSYPIPVDSTMSSVTFSVSGTSAMTVRRPDGAVVSAGDPGVRVVDSSGGRIVSVTAPTAGEWRLEVISGGIVGIKVSCTSSIGIVSFNFVQSDDQSEHGGVTPIEGFPLVGQTIQVQATLAGDIGTAVFEFRTPDGALIQTLKLERGVGEDDHTFVGTIPLPGEPFRAYVVGLDNQGRVFQRTLGGVIQRQSVAVTAPQPQDLHPGAATNYAFEVTNFGAPSTFQIVAADSQGFVQGVSPQSISLGTGETRLVQVTLRPPSSAREGSTSTLTVTAKAVDGTPTQNYATLDSDVISTYSLLTITSGAGQISADRPGGVHPFGTVLTLRAEPEPGNRFIGWYVDRGFHGWANPLALTLDAGHTVEAAFAPNLEFSDLSAQPPATTLAIKELAARSIIRGYEDGRFGPADRILRAQMAALIARAMGWSAEYHGNNFPDRCNMPDICIDSALWQNVGTLQFYEVARGYQDGQGGSYYDPFGDVLHAQTISFITRAMIEQGLWTQQPIDASLYGGILNGSGHEADVATYLHYTNAYGGVPDYPAGGGFAAWDRPATRAWFARALWTALDSYWGTDRTP